jgi:glycosyltransferase involved in cell wall biosynthesis
LRIGLLISGSLDTLTGGYIYDRLLVDYLRRNGNSVEVMNLPCRNYLDRLLMCPGLPLFEEYNQLSLDILLQDELDHPALILLNHKLKSQAGFPIVTIVHNLHSCELRAQWQNRLYRWLEKHYLESVDGLIFNSCTTRQVVEDLVGIRKPAVTAYPCGDRLPANITVAEIQERARTSGPLRILFLGNLLRNKGLDVLLKALSGLSEDGFYLTIVGDLTMDKSYVRSVKNQIRKLNLKNRVSLTGSLNNGKLASRLRESQVLVVPSFYEGFGMSYLEGMGFGLPAIGTTAGAVGEIITPGWNGFLISPGDSAALARHLQELNNYRERLAEMSLNAYQRFYDHPTWQITCERILNFLLSLQMASSRVSANEPVVKN